MRISTIIVIYFFNILASSICSRTERNYLTEDVIWQNKLIEAYGKIIHFINKYVHKMNADGIFGVVLAEGTQMLFFLSKFMYIFVNF